MTDIKSEIGDLKRTVFQYADAQCVSDRSRAWQAVEDAILALDNAAYGRAWTLAGRELIAVRKDRDYRKHCAEDWHQTAIDRAQEIRRLRAERDRLHRQWARCLRDLADARSGRAECDVEQMAVDYENLLTQERQRTTVMTLANSDTGQLLRRMRQERDELQRQFEERGHERDRLRRERDAARAEKERDITRLEAGQLLAERDIARMRLKQVLVELADARETSKELAADGERRATRWLTQRSQNLLRERDEAQNTIKNLRALANMEMARDRRLTKSLGILADRYHAQMCYKNRRHPHSRGSCPYVLAVQDANEALAGESETPRFTGKMSNALLEWSREISQEPEIEVVLVGSSELKCADGCGRVVKQGGTMYRSADQVTDQPLYASKACARRAALLAAARKETDPPPNPVRCRCALPEQKPDITDVDVLRACRGYHERGDCGPFITLAGDFSAGAIRAKMQAMVVRGLLKADTPPLTAQATEEGRRILRVADETERMKVGYECVAGP